MKDAQIYTVIALVAYAITMAIIGIISFGKSKLLTDFSSAEER